MTLTRREIEDAILAAAPDPEPVLVCVAEPVYPNRPLPVSHWRCDVMLCPEAAAEAAEQDRGCYVCGFADCEC